LPHFLLKLPCSRYLAEVALSSAIVLSFFGCAGMNREASKVSGEPARERKVEEVSNSENGACDGDLTRRQIIDIANRAIAVQYGESSDLENGDFDIWISDLVDCQYILSANHKRSTGHFRIRITPSGEILSPPWCCVPGFEVDVSDLIQSPQ
jgi:hypothetical protein